jgi:ribose transport system substrate-binding protein
MGFDTSDPLLQAIADGDIDGVIAQDPYRMGYTGVWTVVHRLRGYDVNPPGSQKSLSTGEYVITKENLNDKATRELFRPELQVQRTIKPPEFKKKTTDHTDNTD